MDLDSTCIARCGFAGNSTRVCVFRMMGVKDKECETFKT
jgi:hypothetical protein